MSSIRTSRTSTFGTSPARRAAVALAATAVATAALASSVPAYAAGQGGRAVRASSLCGMSSIMAKAKQDTGGFLEVGTEVNTNVNGQAWTLSIIDNGVIAWTDTVTTVAPTGAIGVGAAIPNLAGQDVIKLVSTNDTTTAATATAPATTATTTCELNITV